MSSYFEKCKELDFADDNWKSYFFAECSRLAYHDGTRAKRHFKQIGYTTYKFFDVDDINLMIPSVCLKLRVPLLVVLRRGL